MNNLNLETIPKFGEVYYAELVAEGHLQGGMRPVIIAQNNMGNEHSPMINIIPLSSRTSKKPLPMHVLIEQDYGLKYTSIALVEQMRPIPRKSISGNKISTLKHEVLKAIGRAVQMQYPFPYETKT